MESEQLLGLVLVLGFVGFLVWKVKSKKKSSDTTGTGGGGGRPGDGGNQQLK